MFQLTNEEWGVLISRSAISKPGKKSGKRGGRRILPYVFSEHGAIMLASVLNSSRAIATSIQIVRVFVKLRSILESHKELARKIEALGSKYDELFGVGFQALSELMKGCNTARNPIGF